MPAPLKPEMSANLDLLRAVAVLCVFASHLLGALGISQFGSLGRFGVILFFVHTSFVLMGSLQRLKPSAPSNQQLAIAFWFRRLFRIYPLAILFVVMMALLHIPSNPGQTYHWIGTKAFLSNLTLTQNLTYSPDILSPLWSLPLEVQMYGLLPFIYLLIRGDRRYRSLVLWALSVVLALTVPHLSDRLNVFLYAPCFTSGVVAYDLIRSKSWTWKLPAWAWPVGMVAIILLFGPHDNVSLGDKMHRAWAVSLLLGVLYANVQEGSGNILQPVLHWIAEHSYGIYLSHVIVIWFAIYIMAAAPIWARVLVLIAGSIGIPALLYLSVETPLILVGSRIAKNVMENSETQRELQFT